MSELQVGDSVIVNELAVGDIPNYPKVLTTKHIGVVCGVIQSGKAIYIRFALMEYWTHQYLVTTNTS